MKDSSNNSAILIISAFVLVAVYAVMHFTDSPTNSVQLFSGTKGGAAKVVNSNVEGADMYSTNLSGYKARANTPIASANVAIAMPEVVAAPNASITQADVQTVPQKQVARASASAASVFVQSQSKTFKTASVDNLALQQNTAKADINTTLKARTTEPETKTTKKSTVTANKKGPQKAGDKPANPGLGGSLAVGDGTWILLLMSMMYWLRGYVIKRRLAYFRL